jgi:carbon monoxide dehydrogenase subunit G
MSLRFEHAFTVKARPEKVWAYLTDPYRVAPALPGAAITEKTGEGTWNGTITVKVGPVAARYKGTVRFENMDPAARTATIVARGQDLSGRGGADMKMESRLSEKTPGETEVAMASDVNVTGIMAQFGRGLVQDVSNQMFQKFTEAVRAELERPDEPAAPPAPDEAPDEAPAGASAPALESTTAAAVASSAAEAAPATASPASRPVTLVTAASPAPSTAPPPSAAPPIEVLSFGSKILARAAGRMMRKPLFWIVVAAGAGLIYRLFLR